MIRFGLILAWALIGLESSAWAGCELPHAPSKVPDGTHATNDEMVAAMLVLKRYNVDVDNFVKCLDFEARQNRIPRYEQALRHNAAIDTLESIAVRFNEQLRVFKARTSAGTSPPSTTVATR